MTFHLHSYLFIVVIASHDLYINNIFKISHASICLQCYKVETTFYKVGTTLYELVCDIYSFIFEMTSKIKKYFSRRYPPLLSVLVVLKGLCYIV